MPKRMTTKARAHEHTVRKGVTTSKQIKKLKELVLELYRKKGFDYANAYYIHRLLSNRGVLASPAVCEVVLLGLRSDGHLVAIETVKHKYASSLRNRYRRNYYRLKTKTLNRKEASS